MDNTEKISVIVPVYNTEKYLETSVRSLMQQTYRNLEIICVNDGSTDNSLDILKKLQQEDDRIIIVDKPNGGLGDARNHGLAKATSEWIAFVDSDDYLDIDTFNVVAKEAFPHNPDLIHFGTRIIDEEFIGDKTKDEAYYMIRYSGLIECDEKSRNAPDCAAWNKLFRKSIIEKYDLHYENILFEDFQFVNQYRSIINNTYFIPTKFYNYIRRPGSIMSETFKGSPKSIHHLYSFNYLAEFLCRNNILDKYPINVCNMFQNSYMFAVRHATDESIPKIVEYALKVHNRYPLLKNRVGITKKNGTILFYDSEFKHKKSLGTKILEFIFSIKKEYINYKPHKVVRLLNIPIYKKRKLI